jgi:hypothetical protein
VRLVRAVECRKILVQPSRGLELSMPKTTTKPVRMPTRLMATCTGVRIETKGVIGAPFGGGQ